MKPHPYLSALGAALGLAACQSAPPAPVPPSPTPVEQARGIVGKLKTEADALRRLDVLALEGTSRFPAAKRTSYQEKTSQLALRYAEQYRRDLGNLLDLPHGAVEEVFEPLRRTEVATSPGGGVYQTMNLHRRMARVYSEPSWWEYAQFWRSRPPRSSRMERPSAQEIVQDYQALRYFAPPDKRQR